MLTSLIKEVEMSTYLDELEKEVERRIDIIESPDYEFVPDITMVDKIASGIIVIASIAILAIAYNFFA